MKSELQKLYTIRESVLAIDANVSRDKNELRQPCLEVGLNIDDVVSARADLSSLDAKVAEVSSEIKTLDGETKSNLSDTESILEAVSVPDLRAAHASVSQEIRELRDTLSAPQKRYQRYIDSLTEINGKLAEILGSEESPKPGTIHDLKARISHIEQHLQEEIDKKHAARDALAREIFAAKDRIRRFYENLKKSVEARL